MTSEITIREALKSEHLAVGQLMIEVYSQLESFPSKKEMPEYYDMLSKVGTLTENERSKIVVALSSAGELWGAVVYFSNMQDYSSGGPDFDIANASGIRLLAVDPTSCGMGVGKSLTNACIKLALDNKPKKIFLHSTKLVKVTWAMYEKMGFERSTYLDFNLHRLSIYGFRLAIEDNA